MFYSNMKEQYTTFVFWQILDFLHIVQLFSKKEYLFDNACCESFFKYLEREKVNRNTYHFLNETGYRV